MMLPNIIVREGTEGKHTSVLSRFSGASPSESASCHYHLPGHRETLGHGLFGQPQSTILHRKESFCRRTIHVGVNQAEESEGLYAETSTIGFKLNWDRLLASKDLRIEGHKLLKLKSEVAEASPPRGAEKQTKNKVVENIRKPLNFRVKCSLTLKRQRAIKLHGRPSTTHPPEVPTKRVPCSRRKVLGLPQKWPNVPVCPEQHRPSE
ncbi:MAG: hypothetical protein JWM16_5883 [Verrucomicrobiales bacterium]|nr:hypothetical protein [Verrucomicrobiales bacterium]